MVFHVWSVVIGYLTKMMAYLAPSYVWVSFGKSWTVFWIFHYSPCAILPQLAWSLISPAFVDFQVLQYAEPRRANSIMNNIPQKWNHVTLLVCVKYSGKHLRLFRHVAIKVIEHKFRSIEIYIYVYIHVYTQYVYIYIYMCIHIHTVTKVDLQYILIVKTSYLFCPVYKCSSANVWYTSFNMFPSMPSLPVEWDAGRFLSFLF